MLIEVPLDKIEWRVDSKPSQRDGTATCRYVPYLDAATVAALLDECVGPFCWHDEYAPVTLDGKPALLCHLSIREEDGEWVTKTDVGVASNMQSQKGMVSDAFKRAATLKWGIGRNVYQMPTVWAPCRVDDKGKAWPNAQTEAGIQAALKKAGVEADKIGATKEADESEMAPVEDATALQQRVDAVFEAVKAAGVQREIRSLVGAPPWTTDNCDAIEAYLNDLPQNAAPVTPLGEKVRTAREKIATGVRIVDNKIDNTDSRDNEPRFQPGGPDPELEEPF